MGRLSKNHPVLFGTPQLWALALQQNEMFPFLPFIWTALRYSYETNVFSVNATYHEKKNTAHTRQFFERSGEQVLLQTHRCETELSKMRLDKSVLWWCDVPKDGLEGKKACSSACWLNPLLQLRPSLLKALPMEDIQGFWTFCNESMLVALQKQTKCTLVQTNILTHVICKLHLKHKSVCSASTLFWIYGGKSTVTQDFKWITKNLLFCTCINWHTATLNLWRTGPFQKIISST